MKMAFRGYLKLPSLNGVLEIVLSTKTRLANNPNPLDVNRLVIFFL